MTTTFPRSTPSALGIDATGVSSLVRALETTTDVEPHGFVLLRHGQVAAEGWWAPYSAERPHLLYSLSKSFTAAAVGIAAREGLLDLDSTVISHFPELDAEVTDPRSRSMTLRNILAMASGHHEETLERARAIDPDDIVRGFLLLPPDQDPGTVFAYNQPCTYTLAEVVRRVSGTTLVEYLRPRLFDPLGIEQVSWKRDGRGELGFSGCYATTESVAKLGQLYLQRGVWDGERILDEDWVAAATRTQVENPDEENPDWRQGYGYQFWMARHGFRGDGAYGQFCVVLPEHDVVLAITGQSLDMQAVLDAVWAHLLPAIDGNGPVDDDALAEVTAHLALPPVDGERLGTAVREDRVTFTVADRTAVPGLDTVVLERDGDGWSATLTQDGSPVRAPLGEGSWAVSGATAASAAVQSDGRVLVAVRFVDTPHLLWVRCDPDAGTFGARWQTEPLHDRISTLHRPA
ncbi:serine hydrolase [Curtobacterium sp. MCBA15_001]|uniref:serine hydrolase domain-containing protein n=1 Tax=Curtobacterium sp. MCBA15_001 TaxID=1898731 RepID=UPI0008DCCF47|nr:serine hydrolase [Curtobacterium sp. MCBA15_001]OIH97885.1 serine hydrolase [Curtobacterium sp. MCBA15_001]